MQALGASALLLVWLYVMANVIVFGAEINWWHGRRDEVEVAGLAWLAVQRSGVRTLAQISGLVPRRSGKRLLQKILPRPSG